FEIRTLRSRAVPGHEITTVGAGHSRISEALRMLVTNSWQSFTVLGRRLGYLELGARVLGSGSRTTEFSRNSSLCSMEEAMGGNFSRFWVALCLTLAAPLSVSNCWAQQLDTETNSKMPAPKPQEPQVAPPGAPVPAQIITGRKAFVSNLGADTSLILPDHYSGGTDRAYNQFYAAMKGWGRYELVAVPADADLILALSWLAPIGPTDVFQGRGGSVLDP